MCRKLRWVPFFPLFLSFPRGTNPFPRTCAATTGCAPIVAFPFVARQPFSLGKIEFECSLIYQLKFNRGCRRVERRCRRCWNIARRFESRTRNFGELVINNALCFFFFEREKKEKEWSFRGICVESVETVVGQTREVKNIDFATE